MLKMPMLRGRADLPQAQRLTILSMLPSCPMPRFIYGCRNIDEFATTPFEPIPATCVSWSIGRASWRVESKVSARNWLRVVKLEPTKFAKPMRIYVTEHLNDRSATTPLPCLMHIAILSLSPLPSRTSRMKETATFRSNAPALARERVQKSRSSAT